MSTKDEMAALAAFHKAAIRYHVSFSVMMESAAKRLSAQGDKRGAKSCLQRAKVAAARAADHARHLIQT